MDRHVVQLQRRVAIGVLFAVTREFADHAVARFDHVRRIGHAADGGGQLEHRHDVRSLQTPL